MALAAVTIGLLAVGHSLWGVAAMMVVGGTLNSAIPVAWSTWLSKGIRDEPESGGGLMVGTIQLAIMLGAGFGGLLLDHLSIAATFIGSAVLLAIASGCRRLPQEHGSGRNNGESISGSVGAPLEESAALPGNGAPYGLPPFVPFRP